MAETLINTTTFKCPRCNSDLASPTDHDNPTLTCEKCNFSIPAYTYCAAITEGLSVEEFIKKYYETSVNKEKATNILCPQCGEEMSKGVNPKSFDAMLNCKKCEFTVSIDQCQDRNNMYGLDTPLQQAVNNMYIEMYEKPVNSRCKESVQVKSNATTLDTEAFETIVNATLDECKRILINKGHEYQNTSKANSNVLANFERGAKNTGVRAETVLYIFLSKHMDSISTYIRNLQSGQAKAEIEAKLTEPITGRIDDAINYLLLLKGMVVHYKE